MTRLRSGSARAGLSILTTVGLLGLLAYQLDMRTVGRALGELHGPSLGYLALAAALVPMQVILSAARWRFCARRVLEAEAGITVEVVTRAHGELRLVSAVREYFLSMWLNQMLPSGVAGDAVRVLRHARHHGLHVGVAARAAIYDRFAGQMVLMLLALPALVVLLGAANSSERGSGALVGVLIFVTVAAALTLLSARVRRALRRLGRGAGHALLLRGAWLWHLLVGALLVASYIAGFGLCAHALRLDVGPSLLLVAAPAALAAMAIPFSIGGWGVREYAMATAYSLLGLSGEEGAAVSMLYGVTVLAGSSPGLFIAASSWLGSSKEA